MPSERVTISMTDTRPFRRLVAFVEEVRQYAERTEDAELRDLLAVLAADLLEAHE